MSDNELKKEMLIDRLEFIINVLNPDYMELGIKELESLINDIENNNIIPF